MNDNQLLPDLLLKLKSYVSHYRELQQLESQLAPVLRDPFTEETTTRMAVRLAAEREIQGRKDYLADLITMIVVEYFDTRGMLSKCPEPQTIRNET